MTPKPFQLFNILGEGSFGKVYRALTPEGAVVALKTIELESSDYTEINSVIAEVQMLKDLNSPNVTKIFGAAVMGTEIWISIEYCAAGSCLSMLKHIKYFKMDAALYILKETAKGLKYIHNSRIIHRDVKSANILVTATGDIKLGDLGVGAAITASRPVRVSFTGTPYWMAPEVILSKAYNSAVDIWSLGIVAWELIAGRPPLSYVSPNKVIHRIVKDGPPRFSRFTPCPELPSAEYMQFVNMCLNKDPHARPDAERIIHMSLFKRVNRLPASFKVVVEDALAREPPLVDPQEGHSTTSESLEDWDFEDPVKPPPVPPVSPVQPLECKEPKVHKQQSQSYVQVFESCFKLVLGRAKRSEVRMGITHVREAFALADIEIPGFSDVFLEELTLVIAQKQKERRLQCRM